MPVHNLKRLLFRSLPFIYIYIFIIPSVTVNNLQCVSLDLDKFGNFSKYYIQKQCGWVVGFEICSFTRYYPVIFWSDFTPLHTCHQSMNRQVTKCEIQMPNMHHYKVSAYYGPGYLI